MQTVKENLDISYTEQQVDFAKSVLQRWHREDAPTWEECEAHLMKIQRKFSKYPLNIYILNRLVLKVQHRFFKRMAGEIKRTRPASKLSNTVKRPGLLSQTFSSR